VKDDVENRGRISFGSKWKTAMLALRENGPIWCGYLLAYYISSTVADRAHAKMHRLRRDRNLPGLNSAALNRHIWNSWDWSAQGDEWNNSEEWKQSLIRCVLQPNIARDGSILEIGPGAGRWTAALLERARNYIGIDISSACIEHCRKRFDDEPRAQFFVGSGRDLADVANESIDAIWSFDVFVHINAAEVDGYVGEFVRVLRPGGVAIIHHGAVGGSGGGWRSDLTAAALQKMLVQRGLETEKVLDQWTDGAQVQKLTFGDLITVMSRPPEAPRSGN
jgi:ubiquinone/menaquinone biosynthesis C-methylase UbiE